MPFKILGIGSDGKGYFITEAERLVKYNMESLNKDKLRILANYWFWHNSYGYNGKMGGPQWDIAVEDITRITQGKDFDEDQTRGRGAWRDENKISYHDGVKTYGEYDKKKIYLRLLRNDIGINDDPATPELCRDIKNIVFQLSFETPTDAARLLSWATIAPFAGALKFRPAILMTGKSGTGKTTIADLVINKIAIPIWLNGAASTPAFVRQKVKKDTCAIVLDETEAEDEQSRQNRNDLLKLMRASTSDNAPDSGKGGADGNPISYKMKNIFAFISIDPVVDKIADENRIFRINTVKPKNSDNWETIEKKLTEVLSDKNCRAVRSLTWKKLKIIFSLASRIIIPLKKITKRDYRSSYGDAILASVFIVIYNNIDNPTNEQIILTLEKYYQYQPAEEHRNESEEFISEMLNAFTEVHLEDKNIRQKITISECMNHCYELEKEEDKKPYKLQLSRLGIVLVDRNIGISNDSKLVLENLKKQKGFSKILKRHEGWVKNETQYFPHDQRTRRCTILKGILFPESKEDEQEEIPF